MQTTETAFLTVADPTVKAYVAGFLFSPDRRRVLLIRKNRPDWQRGRLNGVGGKIEAGEAPIDAMRREFQEEAGLYVHDWDHVASLSGDGFVVHFFCASDANFDCATQMTDEALVPITVRMMDDFSLINNLRVLIPLALDRSGIKKPVMLTDDRAHRG